MNKNNLKYPSVLDLVGSTPLVQLQRMVSGRNTVLLKLEGNNPAGSVKDRPALSMIEQAEARGTIKPGDKLLEATSGNTGIALAMVAAVKGYGLTLFMPENASLERRQIMAAYGADLVLIPNPNAMEGSIDRAREWEKAGKGIILDQFANPDNPLAHETGTGPEIWKQTQGTVTHFVASTGTTGTIMGTGKALKSFNSAIEVVAAVPAEGSNIPGIRKWPKEYLPAIYDPAGHDRSFAVSQIDAENTTRRLAREEGLLVGISSGGNVWTALQLDAELSGAVIVVIICDRGDRYLSTGVFG